jgi:hypothetical protein
MWKFIKECWNDWILAEESFAEMGIIRIYTVYGVFDYYDATVHQKEKNNNEKNTVV